jgi:hypothetical protein
MTSSGLNGEQRRLLERMPDPAQVPEHVLRAAVDWVPPSGELCRHYGPASIIAYSFASAIRAGVVKVEDGVAREIEHVCENCGDPISGSPAISAEGDAFCAVCTASLMGTEVERLQADVARWQQTARDFNADGAHWKAEVERLRERTQEASEALALIYVMLLGAEPMWDEMPWDERCARAANEAQCAHERLDNELS